MTDKLCSIDGCSIKLYCRDLCDKHYRRLLRHGNPSFRKYSERGKGHIDDQGYRVIRRNGRRTFEHRLVMEGILGRKLSTDENVHHKNGNRLDNSPENLELWVSSQPPGQRPEDLVKWAKEILCKYEPEFLGNGSTPAPTPSGSAH